MKRYETRSEQGQTMAEYGVILAVISAGLLTALLLFSGKILAAFLRTIDLLS